VDNQESRDVHRTRWSNRRRAIPASWYRWRWL